MKKLLLFAVLLCALPALPQGCALCYTQAAGSGAKMIAALKSGILVMMVPPMGICVFLTVLGYKKRDRFHEVEADKDEDRKGPNSDLGW
jgi:4-hydroxybenzoate polyprenyltransferase